MESSSSIEVKVLYGDDLKVYNYFQKPVVFVQVSVVSDDPEKEVEPQIHRTTTVREDVGHPEWNQEMRFALTDAVVGDHDHLFLQFDLRHEGLVFGDKPIGEVRVPFRDLIEGSNGIVRFVSYEVRTPDGKPNGSLNFSYKVNLNGGDSGLGTANLSPAAGNITGYPIIEHNIPYPTSDIHYLLPGSPSFAPEVQYSSPPGAPYPTQDVYYPPPLNGYYPPPPPPPHALGPMLHGPPPPPAAVLHHHHHPPPWAADPQRYSWGGFEYDYSPRWRGPGGGPWPDGHSSSSSWNGR